MEGTACGILSLCDERTRALSCCARHQWVWHGCKHKHLPTHTNMDWLPILSLPNICVKSWDYNILLVDFCVSLWLPSLTSVFILPLSIIFRLTWLFFCWLASIMSPNLCYFSASKWRAPDFSVSLSGRSLVWVCLKYSCQEIPHAQFHPHWRFLSDMTCPSLAQITTTFSACTVCELMALRASRVLLFLTQAFRKRLK